MFTRTYETFVPVPALDWDKFEGTLLSRSFIQGMADCEEKTIGIGNFSNGFSASLVFSNGTDEFSSDVQVMLFDQKGSFVESIGGMPTLVSANTISFVRIGEDKIADVYVMHFFRKEVD
jgi:hypothetical protein